MTKEELIREAYRELQLDPDKNPASMVQIAGFVMRQEPNVLRAPTHWLVIEMAKYIDSQE
jgi:hypothetical protein